MRGNQSLSETEASLAASPPASGVASPSAAVDPPATVATPAPRFLRRGALARLRPTVPRSSTAATPPPVDLTAGTVSPVWEALRGEGGIPEGASDRVVLRRDATFRRTLAAMAMVAASVGLLSALVVIAPGRVHPGSAAIVLLPLVVLC